MAWIGGFLNVYFGPWLRSTDTVKLALNARIEDFPQNYWLDDIP